MPRLMELLDEPAGSVVRPLTLVRPTGEQLDVGLTIADQQVSDGELLRLVRSDDAPPPPEVADVTDVLGDSMRDRAGLWSTIGPRAHRCNCGWRAQLGCCGSAERRSCPARHRCSRLSVTAAVVGRVSMRWICVALSAAALGVAAAAVWGFSARRWGWRHRCGFRRPFSASLLWAGSVLVLASARACGPVLLGSAAWSVSRSRRCR